MTRFVDYNSVADQFDKRYQRSDYSPIYRLLLGFVKSLPSGPVLEVGCGTGHWLAEIGGIEAPCFGLDPSRGMLEVASRRQTGAGVTQGTAEALPLANRSFSCLFCINTFHHFPDKEGFVAEASRVLRPGGGILIVGLDPHTGLDSWWIYDYFPQVVHIDKQRYLSTQSMREMLESHGFTDCRTTEALHFPDKLPARTALETGLLAKSTTSQLTVLADGEYSEGIARLVKDIEASEARGETLAIEADLRLYATTGRLGSTIENQENSFTLLVT